jgi:hypothetical protein
MTSFTPIGTQYLLVQLQLEFIRVLLIKVTRFFVSRPILHKSEQIHKKSTRVRRGRSRASPAPPSYLKNLQQCRFLFTPHCASSTSNSLLGHNVDSPAGTRFLCTILVPAATVLRQLVPYSTLSVQSALYSLPSTLHPLPSTLHPLSSVQYPTVQYPTGTGIWYCTYRCTKQYPFLKEALRYPDI